MFAIILRIIVNALAIMATAAIVQGINVAENDLLTFLIIGLVVGIVNGFVKPIITLLTLPLTILTLGIFLLVINALMLMLIGALLPSVTIEGFLPALIGGVVMAIVGAFLEWITERIFGVDV